MKYKGGAPSGKYTYRELEEWTRRQRDEDTGATSQEQWKGKGAGKKSRIKRDAAEIREEMSKPKRKRKQVDDNDDSGEGTSKPKQKGRKMDDDNYNNDEEDCDKPLKPPVMARGLVIRN